MKRRSFLKNSSFVLAGATGIKTLNHRENEEESPSKITLALNAYSFNKLLLEGKMSHEDLFRYAKESGFSAIDLTAYYIPGYPNVPEDKVLFDIKRRAFRHGMAISGTGVRNDFTVSDPQEHRQNIDLVKSWVVAASKLGAPHLRVFAGRGQALSSAKETARDRIIEAFKECADFASGHGVMVVFQNHNDFIKSTADIWYIMEQVKSEWFGFMLDIGSIPGSNPYADIKKLVPYATTWQVKEEVFKGELKVPTDFNRLMKIVKESQYRGYFPLETLGEGDPYEKVKKLYKRVTDNML